MNERDSNEHLSAFVDGELEGSKRDRVVDALYDNPELRRRWTRFHLIGDAVRGAGPVPGADAIADNVRAALAEEQVVQFKPRPRRPRLYPLYGMAMAAAIAGIAILGILRLDDGGARSTQIADVSRSEPAAADSVSTAPVRTGPRIASVAAQPAGTEAARLQWSDVAPDAEARLNVYLVNHNEYAGIGMHSVLPYVRIVGYQSFAGD